MNNDLHDIDNLFRDGIEGHREPISPAVWEGINQSLDRQQAAHFKQKYYKLRRWLLLLLLIGTLGGGYFLIGKLKEPLSEKEQGYAPRTAPPTDQPQSTNRASSATGPKQQQQQIAKEKSKDTVSKTAIADRPETTGLTIQKDRVQNEIEPVDEPGFNPAAGIHEEIKAGAATSLNHRTLNKRDTRIAVAVKERSSSNLASVSKQSGSNVSKDHFSATPVATKDRSLLIELQNAGIANPKEFVSLQEPTNKKAGATSSHGFSLHVFAAPNLSFDRMEDDDHLSGPGRNRKDFDKQEKETASFSAGVLLSYGLSKTLSLESGFIFSTSTTEIGSKKVYAKADGNGRTRYQFECSSGYSYISSKGVSQPAAGDSALLSNGKISLSYLTVPLALNFSVDFGRFSVRPSIGFGTNFLLSGKSQVSLAAASGTERSTNAISGLKSTYLDGRLGLGVEYRVNKRLSAGIRPAARIAFSSINEQTPVRSFQNYLSVETGIRIKL